MKIAAARWRRALLGGAVLPLGLATSAAALQNLKVLDVPDEETILFRADNVSRERTEGPVMVTGNVEAYHSGQTLTADSLIYDPDIGSVVAVGNVSVTDPQGQTYYADEVELTDSLDDGVATNFSALVQGNRRITGASVTRRSSGVSDIRNASFTPCAICSEKGRSKRPLWQLDASRIIHDRDDQKIRFRNARFGVLGVPIFYVPYLESHDPTVKRKTGFLAPGFANSLVTGFELTIPFYWEISDYKDLTLAPTYSEQLGTLFKGEYRERYYNGGTIIQAGIIDPKGVFQVRGNNFLDGLILIKTDENVDLQQFAEDNGGGDYEELRWHFFGETQRNYRDSWLARLDIDAVSDNNYLRTYDIEPEGELIERQALFFINRLDSVAEVSQLTDDTFTSVRAIEFQSLVGSQNNDLIADVYPQIHHERSFDAPVIGGKITLAGDFLYLHRKAGLDTARVVASTTYENTFNRGNHRFRTFAQLRVDGYRYRDASFGTQECFDDGSRRVIPVRDDEGDAILVDNQTINRDFAVFDQCRNQLPGAGVEDEFSTARILPMAGAEWSYPLVKFSDVGTFIIEPRVQGIVAPERDDFFEVFNEDSEFFQLDTTTLFDWIKSTGYDRWEDGTRLNVGVFGRAYFDNEIEMRGSIGQQYRAQLSDAEELSRELSELRAIDRANELDRGVQNELIFSGTGPLLAVPPSNYLNSSGVGGITSDIVGTADISYGSGFGFGPKPVIGLENRFRLDDSDGSLREFEARASVRVFGAGGSVSYLRTEGLTIEQSNQESLVEYLSAGGGVSIGDFRFGGLVATDLESARLASRSLSASYRNQCAFIGINYTEFNFDNDGLPQGRNFIVNFDLTGF